MPSFRTQQPDASPMLDFSPKRGGDGIMVRDWRAGYIPVSDIRLKRTGLRGPKLIAILLFLLILWLLAIATFTCNILLIVFLEMGPKGLPYMQFLRRTSDSGESESLIQFPQKVDFDTLSLKNGQIKSYHQESIDIESSRVIGSTVLKEKGGVASLVLEDGRIRAEGVDNFFVLTNSGRPIFNAINPIEFDRNLFKKIAAKQIVTNVVRSPRGSQLRIDVGNAMIRGNEGNYFYTNSSLRIRAHNNIHLRATSGSLRLVAKGGVFFSPSDQFPIMKTTFSPSDAIENGYQICVVSNRGGAMKGRMFVVSWNATCRINPRQLEKTP